MTIIDITKDLFEADVYPGDPIPQMKRVLSFEKKVPDICQVTELTMGSHTGTHLDAPLHFIPSSRDVAQIDLGKCIGKCQVIEYNGMLTKAVISPVITAEVKKLLFKGDVKIGIDMAMYLKEIGIECIGVEMGTVATGEEQADVHRILLGAEIVIIEGLNLSHVDEGEYFLFACPLRMAGVDGSPVRAILCRD